MRNLTPEEEKFLRNLQEKNACLHQGYFSYRIKVDGTYRRYKRARVVFQLSTCKYLERWELVSHKDRDKQNDAIENLEVLNSFEVATKYPDKDYSKPENWKPANTTPPEVVNRIKEIASTMVKINCSEISRKLEKQGIKIASVTVKRYL